MQLLKFAILAASVALLALWWWYPGFVEPEEGGNRSPQTQRAVADVNGPGTAAFADFPQSRNRPAVLKFLGDFRAGLLAMPREEALDRVRSFLASGGDQATGLSFEPGDGDTLAQWPTFRTFLLDVLLTIDAQAAADISMEILAAPTTADEWALALRNIARAESNGSQADFLRAKTEELIAYPAWQENPTAGYLNAFDVLVHTESTASTPLLSGLLRRKDREELVHAAFITLDRLVQRQPVEVLGFLASDRALRESRPEMVAQQFARADPRDPVQRGLVRNWLLDATRNTIELQAFAAVYPHSNFMISDNLLTRTQVPSGAELDARDRAALSILDAWSEEEGFAHLMPWISEIRQRLDARLGE